MIRPILGVSSVFRRLILTIGIRTILAGCSRRLVLFVLACGSGFLALCSLRAALPLSIECNFRLFVDGSSYGQIAYPSSIFPVFKLECTPCAASSTLAFYLTIRQLRWQLGSNPHLARVVAEENCSVRCSRTFRVAVKTTSEGR